MAKQKPSRVSPDAKLRREIEDERRQEPQWQRLDRISDDNLFQKLKGRVILALKRAYKIQPKTVIQFFTYQTPGAGGLRSSKRFLSNVTNNTVLNALNQYCQFASRFRVRLRLIGKSCNFKLAPGHSFGPKFHVRMKGSHLYPVKPYRHSKGDSLFDYFETDSIVGPAELELEIQNGRMNFMMIDDKSGKSVLSQLETAVYDPDKIAVVVHKAEKPYLLWMIGEKVTQPQLRQMGKVLTSLQRQYFNRGKAGRKGHTATLSEVVDDLIAGKRKKEIAVDISSSMDPEDIQKAKVQVSRISRKLRGK